MSEIFFRTEYNYDRDQATLDTALFCKDPSKTKQEFVKDADINNIIERFGIGYEMPINTTPPAQGDFTNLPDFRAAQDKIREATQTFQALPAKIRNRFENDPHQYIDFFHDPDNQEEAIALGLAKRRPAEETPPAPPTTAPMAPKTA